MLSNFNSASIFGGEDTIMETALADPNQYRESVIYETLSRLPGKKLNEFVNSEEARVMIQEGIISHHALEKLAHEHNDGVFVTSICHLAKDNQDPLWDEFVKARIEERRVMNELIAKYADAAKPVADEARKEFIDKCIPEHFRA